MTEQTESVPDTATIPETPPVEQLASLPRDTLEYMHGAGEEVLDCLRVLHKPGLNLVGELLREQGTFYELNHYPKGDVYDPESSSQYYYHAHRGIEGEHGHIHTFLRAKGMPQEAQPVAYDGEVEWPRGDEAVSHIVCVSMDQSGMPLGLFATNRWVTDEAWYPAEQVIKMAEHFCIDHAFPSWPVNRWLTAMFTLFMPEIRALLRQRDEVVARWAQAYPQVDVFEDRRLEITGSLPVSVVRRVEEIHALVEGTSAG